MTFLSVNPEKCNKCKTCVSICPMFVLELKEGESVPTPVDYLKDQCLDCGQCAAVCPTAALAHRSLSPDNSIPLKSDLNVSPEQVEQLLRSRRSIRTYKKAPVEKDKIQKLLELSSCAPTSHNDRAVHWTVLYEAEEMKKITGIVFDWFKHMINEYPEMADSLLPINEMYKSGKDMIFRNAPHIVVASGPAPTTYTAPEIDCVTAIAYLEIVALGIGIGTCWSGAFNNAAKAWPPLQEALNLPEGHQVFGAVLLGHPKFKYSRIPLRDDTSISWK